MRVIQAIGWLLMATGVAVAFIALTWAMSLVVWDAFRSQDPVLVILASAMAGGWLALVGAAVVKSRGGSRP
jgi:hypothetical protein